MLATFPIVTFLASQPDFTGSLYGFQKEYGISTADATAELCSACSAGMAEAKVEDRNGKRVLTAALSKRAVRKFNRARREQNASANIDAVMTALEAKRPQRVGDLVESTGMERQAVIDACKAAVEAGKLFKFNSTNSNFHVFYNSQEDNAIFPEPVEEEPEAEAAPAETEETESSEDEVEIELDMSEAADAE